MLFTETAFGRIGQGRTPASLHRGRSKTTLPRGTNGRSQSQARSPGYRNDPHISAKRAVIRPAEIWFEESSTSLRGLSGCRRIGSIQETQNRLPEQRTTDLLLGWRFKRCANSTRWSISSQTKDRRLRCQAGIDRPRQLFWDNVPRFIPRAWTKTNRSPALWCTTDWILRGKYSADRLDYNDCSHRTNHLRHRIPDSRCTVTLHSNYGLKMST